MQDFRELHVWQKAHQLTLRVYKATVAFPSFENYGLTAQVRRAAASMGANIAEGCCRGTRSELARFLHIATGSAGELEYHLILAIDLGYLKPESGQELVEHTTEVKRMLTSLIATVRAADRATKTKGKRAITG